MLVRAIAPIVTVVAIAVPGHAQLAFLASADPGRVVIQLRQDVGIEGDDIPLLRVYGDGRVLVHFPVYRPRAGDFSLQLNPAELNGLLLTFVQGGLGEFNRERVGNEIRQLRRANQQAALRTGSQISLTSRSDETIHSFEVRLESYTGPDGATRQDVSLPITWAGAQHDARDFPGVAAIQNLAALERQLLAITERPDLVPVSP